MNDVKTYSLLLLIGGVVVIYALFFKKADGDKDAKNKGSGDESEPGNGKVKKLLYNENGEIKAFLHFTLLPIITCIIAWTFVYAIGQELIFFRAVRDSYLTYLIIYLLYINILSTSSGPKKFPALKKLESATALIMILLLAVQIIRVINVDVDGRSIRIDKILRFYGGPINNTRTHNSKAEVNIEESQKPSPVVDQTPRPPQVITKKVKNLLVKKGEWSPIMDRSQEEFFVTKTHGREILVDGEIFPWPQGETIGLFGDYIQIRCSVRDIYLTGQVVQNPEVLRVK